MLKPNTPEEKRTLFLLIRDELKKDVVGRDDVVNRLALSGTQHLSGTSLVRALLIGPPGSGKTTLLRSLARVVDLPWIECSAALMSEEGWQGADLSDHLKMLYRKTLKDASGLRDARIRAQRGIVIVDEFCKLRIRPGERGSSLAQHIGKQQSLLGLWDGATFTVETGTGPGVEWDASRTLVVGCGVFDELDGEIPSSGDFAEWGLLPELAERVSRGSVLRLPPLRQSELELVLLLGLEKIEATFASFGYRLVISDAALSMVAATLRKPEFEAGVRAGMGWLASACERAPVRMLREAAPSGAIFTLSPDAVRIPDPPAPKWRDS